LHSSKLCFKKLKIRKLLRRKRDYLIKFVIKNYLNIVDFYDTSIWNMLECPISREFKVFFDQVFGRDFIIIYEDNAL